MIVQNNSAAFAEDPVHKMNFEKFANDQNTSNIVFHVDSMKRYDNFSKIEKYKYYLLDLELPNRWINHDTRYQSHQNEKIYDKIFSICPYTTKHRNSFLQKELYQSVFFPYPDEFILDIHHKKYDVIYCGNSDFSWSKKINFINFNSISIGNNFLMGTTRMTPSYQEKIKLFANSKVSIVWNEYPLCNEAYDNIQSLGNVEDYFKIINKKLTQHKSRVMEAAFGKSLIICKKDEFNIIEHIFEEGKDFIYFDEYNINDILEEVIRKNENYEFMAQNAFKKAVNYYTVNSFYKRYILNGENHEKNDCDNNN